MATSLLVGQGLTPANRPNPNLLPHVHPYPHDYMGPQVIAESFAAQGVTLLIPTHPLAAREPVAVTAIPSVDGAAVDLEAWCYNRLARTWVVKTYVTGEDGANPYQWIIEHPGDDPIYFEVVSASLNASVALYVDPGPDGLWIALPLPFDNPAGFGPQNTLEPSLTGNPLVGQALTCNLGTWSGSMPITYSYQWSRNGIAIVGATEETYTVQAADYNTVLRCRVLASNALANATASTGGVLVPQPVANTSPPAIAGVPGLGSLLTANTGTWAGSVPITYAYQWTRDGQPISGADEASYTIAEDDLGKALRVAITATNAAGANTVVSGPVSAQVDPSLDFSDPQNSQYLPLLLGV
jgi:hypothetical protein